MAALFGSSGRMLRKGTDERSDIISDMFMVDAKLRKRWSIQGWYRELRTAAGKEGKIPILTVRQPGMRLRLAVLEYLISIMKGGNVLDADNESTGSP